jgi:hypothetical protein
MATRNATWEAAEWTFGEQPLECYRLKVNRGYIYLHLRPRFDDPTKADWEYTCSFGPNSDNSCSGSFYPERLTLEQAKEHIEAKVIPGLQF